VLENLCTATLDQLQDKSEYANQDVTFGGIVNSQPREGLTKKGNPYGIVLLEDYSNTLEIALFGDDWAKWKGYFSAGNSVFVSARIEPHRFRPDEYDLKIGNIEFLADVKDKRIEKLTIDINLEKLTEYSLNELLALIETNEGETPLFINIKDNDYNTSIPLTSRGKCINVNKNVIDYLSKNDVFRYSIN
jgi:DNA polymerase-3 subunit alpha